MKKTIIPILIIILLSSCSFLEKHICSNYESDNDCFRSSANALSADAQFAKDKALMIAKQNIAEAVDIYILDKFSHQTFLADPEFENKINAARKVVLKDITVVCNRIITKKDMYKAFVAIEITKESIDEELKNRLKEATQ
ncbi:MAG: lipoprotein [Bacteroidales bacterium]|nr:lipoprotein [Bacteroidales bacterium]MDD4217760.1 lipoprotein [Bacteroidales bacterium]MDY0142156.1 lipoprotein [Bacteroidales bacterium]